MGWCVGTIDSRNTDRRFVKTIDGEKVPSNFCIHYEIDDETTNTALRLNEYDGDEEGSWVLLESVFAPAAAAEPEVGEEAGEEAVAEFGIAGGWMAV